jgi:hypothetical protein
MNQFVRPGSERLRGRWFWLASAAALMAAVGSAGGCVLPAANIYGQETAALADAATAQDLVNLLLVAPACDTRMVGAPRALTRLSRMGRVPRPSHDGVTSRHLACATTQTKEAIEMPKVSRDSAPQRQDAGPVVDLRDELDGYTVSFTSLLEDIDATPLTKGLPDDRCQCPHWGYVIKGKMTARYADHDEVFEAGDAFYTPPGHVPVNNEPGTEILWFSPSEELRTAEAVMMKNMQAMRDGSTPQ